MSMNCSRRFRQALWPIVFIVLMLILLYTTFSNMSRLMVYTIFLVILIVWITINLATVVIRSTPTPNQLHITHGYQIHGSTTSSPPPPPPADESVPNQFSHRPRVARLMLGSAVARSGPYYGSRIIHFGRRAQISRMAIRALPPVKVFNGDERETTTESQLECPICMEEFKNGELIQPFGLCVHEFHSSCLSSWLHSGNTTCPVCREDLITLVR